MPSIKRKLCTKHGIYETKSCELCKKQTARVYDSQARSKESYKIYHSTRWKKLREKQLSLYPLCANFEECRSVAKIADHTTEIRDGGEPYSLDNLQSLCQACHNTKTARNRRDRE